MPEPEFHAEFHAIEEQDRDHSALRVVKHISREVRGGDEDAEFEPAKQRTPGLVNRAASDVLLPSLGLRRCGVRDIVGCWAYFRSLG